VGDGRACAGRERGVEAGDAEEEVGGAASVGALALAGVDGLGGLAADLVGLGVDVCAEGEGEGVDGVGEERGGAGAGALRGDGLDAVEDGADVGAGEPDGECDERGAVACGGLVERGEGIDDGGDDGVGLFWRGIEVGGVVAAPDGDGVVGLVGCGCVLCLGGACVGVVGVTRGAGVVGGARGVCGGVVQGCGWWCCHARCSL